MSMPRWPKVSETRLLNATMSASHGARSARLGPSPLPGPGSLQQLFEFPADSLARLCSGTDGPASRDRLARNLELQWVFTEDYAGMSTASMALGMIAAEAEAAGLTSAPPFSMHRVCDNNSICHRVLGCDPDLRLPGSCCLAPKHVFGDLERSIAARPEESSRVPRPGRVNDEAGEAAHVQQHASGPAGERHRQLICLSSSIMFRARWSDVPFTS